MEDLIIPVKSGGITRRYILHLPQGSTPTQKMPLFILCHGGGGSREQFRSQCNFNPIADAFNCLCAYPNGSQQVAGGGFIWNTPPCFTTAFNDVTYLSQDLPQSAVSYGVDLNRVYVGGFSDGGSIGWKTYREASDLVAAFFSHSGSMGLGQTSPQPTNPRPFLYMQGLDDTVNPVNGGFGPDDPGMCNHASFWSGLSFLTWQNKIIAPPVRQDIHSNSGSYHQADYQGSAAIRTILIDAEGHNWTGGKPLGAPFGTQEYSDAFSASMMVARFCFPFSL